MNATLLVLALNLLGVASQCLFNPHTKKAILRDKNQQRVLLEPVKTEGVRASRRQSASCELFKIALLGFLFRAPAQESGAMTKTSAGEMIVLHFDHQFCFERLPFA